MFAQAISEHDAVIEISRMSGVRFCACMELWPRRPSSSVISLALNFTIVGGAHARLQRRLDVVDDRFVDGVDGDLACSIVTPGLSRANRYTQ